MNFRITIFFISILFFLSYLNISKSYASIEYTVHSGDTLYGLARKYNTSVDNLKKLNHLNTINLRIGQKLLLNDNDSTGSKNKLIYKVVNGDTLGGIANRYGMSSRDLIKANNLPNAKLSIGQEIIIPETDTKPVADSRNVNHFAGSSISQNSPIVAQYIVKEGDNLFNIAQVFDVSVDSLKSINRLNVDKLTPGTKLLIPSSDQLDNETVNRYTEKPYTVQSGDTLSEIAEKFGVSTSRLQLYNNLFENDLQIGQKLLVPYAENHATAQTDKAQANKETVKETSTVKEELYAYTVVSGDTLSQIAGKFNISTTSLKETNNLDSSSIRVGQTLYIPGKPVAHSNVLVARNHPDTENASKNQGTKSYRIKRGDSLSQIAENFGTSTSNLMEINGLGKTALVAGQTIQVPDNGSYPSSGSSQKTVSYEVKKGDTLYKIARRYGTKVDLIKDINNLGSNNISIGKKLLIPGDNYVKSSDSDNSETFVYRIERGDTLASVSRKFGTSVKNIKNINKLNGNNIIAGSTLVIPAPDSLTVRYKVKKGDNLSYIASKNGSEVNLIKKANDLDGSSIYVGQVLEVPVTDPETVSAAYAARDRDLSPQHPYESNIANKIISVAKKYLGVPYKFGGESTRTGIDCSAYVNKVFSKFNVQLPRTARDIYKEGKWVDKDELQKGDLVFFRTYAKYPSHIGIYIGNNKFIHASSAAKQVTITDLTRRYYRKRYIGAKRITVKGLFYEQYSKDFDDYDKNYN